MRCRSCGARLGLNDYYNRTLPQSAAGSNDEELEARLANVPINRL